MSSWPRGGLDHGHYHTGHPRMWNMHYNQASQADKASVVWSMMAEIWIRGGLADWLYHTPTNLPKQTPCAYNRGSKNWMSGNLPCAPCHGPQHYPRPWNASFIATWHPRNSWVRQQASFPKEPRRHLGQRAWHWVEVSHPLSSISLWENQIIHWTVKNYSESNGWWYL